MTTRSNNAIEGNRLPDGWTEAPLRQLLAVLEAGSRPRGGVRGVATGVPSIGGEHLNNHGGFDFSNIRFVPTEFARLMSRGHVSQGDILIVKDGATTGKVALILPDFPYPRAVINEHVFRCHPFDGIAPAFISWFLWSRDGQKRILENFQGSAQGGINQSFADNTDVPVAPLSEQQRIVESIARLTTGVNAVGERLARITPIIRRFRQAVLAAACCGRLTEDWRDANPRVEPTSGYLARFDSQAAKRHGTNARKGGEELDLEAMPELPETWAYRRADSLVAHGTIITYGIVLPGPEIPEGVPYVRQQDIQDGRVLVDQLRHTTSEIAAKHERSALLSGDVLLCIIRHLRVAIVPPGIDGANLTQGTVRMRPSPVMTGPFLAKYLAGPHAQAWMKQRHFGMSMPRINVEHARAIPVAVPPPSEQCEIARRVEALMKLADAIEQRVALASARADKTTQAILAKAFRGELVPTEADLARAEGRDFEPASELIARIQSVNHAAPPKRRNVKGRPKRRPKR